MYFADENNLRAKTGESKQERVEIDICIVIKERKLKTDFAGACKAEPVRKLRLQIQSMNIQERLTARKSSTQPHVPNCLIGLPLMKDLIIARADQPLFVQYDWKVCCVDVNAVYHTRAYDNDRNTR